MENLKSCLVLQDHVYCPDYDDHEYMLNKLGIKGGYQSASEIFVHVELLPPDGVKSLMEPLDKWTLKVDQDVTPEWWDEEADRPRVEEAVEEWRKEHVFADGKHIVENGKVYVLGDAMAKAYNNAIVRACGNATVEAYDSAKVAADGGAKVEAYGNATVKAIGNATVEARGNATVEAYDSARVEAYHSAIVEAWGNTRVEARGDATVKAYSWATVKAYDNANVEAYDCARIEARGDAMVKAHNSVVVIYPLKDKIVYPAGWTAETHD